MTDTASWLEVVWTTINLLGLGVMLYTLYLVKGDLCAIEQHATFVKNGLRHLQAKAQLRTKRIKAWIIAGNLLIGFALMSTEPPGGHHYTQTSLIIAAVFIGTALSLIYDSIMYVVGRKQILRKIANGEDYR